MLYSHHTGSDGAYFTYPRGIGGYGYGGGIGYGVGYGGYGYGANGLRGLGYPGVQIQNAATIRAVIGDTTYRAPDPRSDYPIAWNPNINNSTRQQYGPNSEMADLVAEVERRKQLMLGDPRHPNSPNLANLRAQMIKDYGAKGDAAVELVETNGRSSFYRGNPSYPGSVPGYGPATGMGAPGPDSSSSINPLWKWGGAVAGAVGAYSIMGSAGIGLGDGWLGVIGLGIGAAIGMFSGTKLGSAITSFMTPVTPPVTPGVVTAPTPSTHSRYTHVDADIPRTPTAAEETARRERVARAAARSATPISTRNEDATAYSPQSEGTLHNTPLVRNTKMPEGLPPARYTYGNPYDTAPKGQAVVDGLVDNFADAHNGRRPNNDELKQLVADKRFFDAKQRLTNPYAPGPIADSAYDFSEPVAPAGGPSNRSAAPKGRSAPTGNNGR